MPKLILAMKTYTKKQFLKDVTAGVIVAIIALPLSIALAIASGVSPERGIYTAIVTGFILIIMGLFKFGALVKYIPYTIITGFTSGIAVTIFIGQIKDFLGLTFDTMSIETLGKLEQIFISIGTINWLAVMIGIIALIILIGWPKINAKIPSSLIAILVTVALVKILNLEVNSIGSLFTISNALPQFAVSVFNFDLIKSILPDAFIIAFFSCCRILAFLCGF